MGRGYPLTRVFISVYTVPVDRRETGKETV